MKNWMQLLFLTAGFVLFGRYALVLIGSIAASALSIRSGYRNLGGMNGDISGHAITTGELWGIVVLAVMGGMS